MSDAPAEHIPVLTDPVMTCLRVAPGDVVLDATVGLGGHARLLGEAAGEGGLLIGLDADADNLQIADRRLQSCPATVRLFHVNFARIDEVLNEAGVENADVILADLGVSSNQLEDATRGFSFAAGGPLDMRIDRTQGRTAADLVNALREDELSDLIYGNSQERFSRRIARRICEARRNKRITTTDELARLVADALHVDPASRASKIHPATRTFMALRIAVNDELNALRTFLEKAARRLKPGGRIAVIAFHSLEDGIVKREFATRRQAGQYRILTKRPILAKPAERQSNPRSRSAKLRAAQRVGGVPEHHG